MLVNKSFHCRLPEIYIKRVTIKRSLNGNRIIFIDSLTIDESDKIDKINTSSACEYRILSDWPIKSISLKINLSIDIYLSNDFLISIFIDWLRRAFQICRTWPVCFGMLVVMLSNQIYNRTQPFYTGVLVAVLLCLSSLIQFTESVPNVRDNKW